MFGIIGKLLAVDGKREELIQLLLDGSINMPGCLSYVVAEDIQDENTIWITEVWLDQESHQASLTLPSVQETIEKGRPLIAGFGERFETRPSRGHRINK